MNYSMTQGGLLVAVVGILLVQFGFSDSCSNEIIAQTSPIVGALPGIIMAWVGRVRAGGVTILGMKK